MDGAHQSPSPDDRNRQGDGTAAPAGSSDGGGSGGSPRRRLAVRVGLFGGAAAMFAALAAAVVEGPPADHDATHPHGVPAAGRPVVAPRAVGQPQVARVSGGSSAVTLRVEASVARAPRGGTLSSIPVGAPARLSFELPPGLDSGRMPRLTAHRMDLSLARMLERESQPSGGHDDAEKSHEAGGHGHEDSTGLGDRVSLTRRETFVLDRASGDVMVPAGSAGEDHDHQPGKQLAAATMPDGGAAFAAKFTPGIEHTAVDADLRYLAVSHRDGLVETLDLLDRGRPRAIETALSPARLRFAPDGRLWALDRERGVAVIDVDQRQVAATLGDAGSVKAIAFAGDDRALLTYSDRAELVDTRSLKTLESRSLAPGATDVAFSAQRRAFVVTHTDGMLSVIALDGRDALTAPTPIRTGVEEALERVGIANGGRSVVALSPGADRMVVVDLVRQRVVAAIEAPGEPRDLLFVGDFALARASRTTDLTWVDVENPSRSNSMQVGSKPARGLEVSSDGRSVLVPSPADRAVFTLDVMMGRPMLMGQIRSAIPADTVVSAGAGLQRSGDGRVEQRSAFETPGRYHLELAFGNGRRAQFEVVVSAPAEKTATVRPGRSRMTARAGQSVVVRFAMAGPQRADAEVVAYTTTGGIGQVRVPARRVGDSTYEARLTPPGPGRYRVVLTSEQAGITAATATSPMTLVVGNRVPA